MFTKTPYVQPALREIALTTGAYRICLGSIEEYSGSTSGYDDDSD